MGLQRGKCSERGRNLCYFLLTKMYICFCNQQTRSRTGGAAGLTGVCWQELVTAEATPLASTSLGPGGSRAGRERPEAEPGAFGGRWGPVVGEGCPHLEGTRITLQAPRCCPPSWEWFRPVIHLAWSCLFPWVPPMPWGPVLWVSSGSYCSQFPFLHQAVIPLRRESIWARTWQRRVSPLGNWGRGGGLWGDPSRWGRKARAPCELQGDTCHFLNGAVLMWTPETGPQKRLCSPGAACGVYQMRWYGPPLPTPPPRPQGPLASHSPLPQASAHPHCQTGGHSQGGPGGRCPNPVCGCEVSGGDAA